MDSYIFFDTALRMLVNGYLFSVILLLAVSSIGLAAIEILERAGEH